MYFLKDYVEPLVVLKCIFAMYFYLTLIENIVQHVDSVI